MADFQYTTVPGKIPILFEKLRTVGVPPKATHSWLKSIGFTSSNDASLISVLKGAGFVDAHGVPAESWRLYRGGEHRKVLAASLKSSYATLFATYEDAWARTDTELSNFFSTKSNAGSQVITKTVSTFKALAKLADFVSEGEAAAIPPASVSAQAPLDAGGRQRRPAAAPNLHIDMQIHISSDASAAQIDQIFSSMAKHLYKD